MFYKEWKYLAAHRILKRLYKYSFFKMKTSDKREYGMLEIHEVKPVWFSIGTLRDAAFTLKASNKIDLWDDAHSHKNIRVRILADGITAYKEKEYLWCFWKSWKTLLLGAVAVITALLGFLTDDLSKLLKILHLTK